MKKIWKKLNISVERKTSRLTVYSHENSITDEFLEDEEEKIQSQLKKLNIESRGYYSY